MNYLRNKKVKIYKNDIKTIQKIPINDPSTTATGVRRTPPWRKTDPHQAVEKGQLRKGK